MAENRLSQPRLLSPEPESAPAAGRSQGNHEGPGAGYRIKRAFFTVGLTTAFGLGFYSLFLAVVQANSVQLSNIADLQRTATPADVVNIETAVGELIEQDLVYVVVDDSELGPHQAIENAAMGATDALSESGVDAGVRFVGFNHPDFLSIVEQNRIDRFPVVLVVKNDGGIVLVTDRFSEENLQHVYMGVWGKTSSCEEAVAEVF